LIRHTTVPQATDVTSQYPPQCLVALVHAARLASWTIRLADELKAPFATYTGSGGTGKPAID
jgi:hypothetical protein